jgi:hypothetical protein
MQKHDNHTMIPIIGCQSDKYSYRIHLLVSMLRKLTLRTLSFQPLLTP